MSLSNKDLMMLELFNYIENQGSKLHMREEDYKRFQNRCAYRIGINDDITGNHSEGTEDKICFDYEEACKNGYFCLDYSSTYGGFIVEKFSKGSTGVDNGVFYSGRLTAKDLGSALKFYNRGFYQRGEK